MKKIGSKVLLMMVLFVVIFGLNTITSVRSQNRVKRSGLENTEQYIPIQTEIFTIQKSMERGQKYLNIISLYDNAELRQQLEGSLAEEVSTITDRFFLLTSLLFLYFQPTRYPLSQERRVPLSN